MEFIDLYVGNMFRVSTVRDGRHTSINNTNSSTEQERAEFIDLYVVALCGKRP